MSTSSRSRYSTVSFRRWNGANKYRTKSNKCWKEEGIHGKRKKRETERRGNSERALMFPISIGISQEELLCGTKELDGVKSGVWLTAKKREKTASLRGITESVSCSFLSATPLAQTSMLSGDKVLFFTKPPSVAQARPIRRQWLVNSSQSVGKPRRDRDPRRDIAYELFKRPEQQRVPVSSTCVLIRRRHISLRILIQ